MIKFDADKAKYLKLIADIKTEIFKNHIFVLPFHSSSSQEMLTLLVDALNHNSFITTLDLRQTLLSDDEMIFLINHLNTLNKTLTRIQTNIGYESALPLHISPDDSQNTPKEEDSNRFSREKLIQLLVTVNELCFKNQLLSLERERKESEEIKENEEKVFAEEQHTLTIFGGNTEDCFLGDGEDEYTWCIDYQQIHQLLDLVGAQLKIKTVIFEKVSFALIDKIGAPITLSKNEGPQPNKKPIKIGFHCCDFYHASSRILLQVFGENKYCQLQEVEFLMKDPDNDTPFPQLILSYRQLILDQFNALRQNKTVTAFKFFTENCIYRYSYPHLAKTLQELLTENTTLKKIDITCANIFSDEDEPMIINGMKANSSLEVFHISYAEDRNKDNFFNALLGLKTLTTVDFRNYMGHNVLIEKIVARLVSMDCKIKTLLMPINHDPKNVEILASALSKNHCLESLTLFIADPATGDMPKTAPTDVLKALDSKLGSVLAYHPTLRTIDILLDTDHHTFHEEDIKLKDEVLTRLREACTCYFDVFLIGAFMRHDTKPNESTLSKYFTSSPIFDPYLMKEMFGMCWAPKKNPPPIKIDDASKKGHSADDDNPRPTKKAKP